MVKIFTIVKIIHGVIDVALFIYSYKKCNYDVLISTFVGVIWVPIHLIKFYWRKTIGFLTWLKMVVCYIAWLRYENWKVEVLRFIFFKWLICLFHEIWYHCLKCFFERNWRIFHWLDELNHRIENCGNLLRLLKRLNMLWCFC